MHKKIFVIVNSISGSKDKKKLIEKIKKKLEGCDFKILITKAPKHATELARTALGQEADIIAVVGGDGTVNEVGQALIGTNTSLAIIPAGSGNGLARHLKIPLNSSKSIDLLKTNDVKTIDTICVNERITLGVAGLGFDAEVGWSFARSKKRGFFTYFFSALKHLPNYCPQEYQLLLDGNKISRNAFLISFANSSQFGNGACISPHAKINDGLLDVVILKKFPFYAALQIVYQLFHNTLHLSRYVEIIRCKTIHIPQSNLKAHIDGEPIFFSEGMRLQVLPASLNVLVPKNSPKNN